VPGALVLLGGEPGIGKSTLLLQVAAHISRNIGPVLYSSGEESEHQNKLATLKPEEKLEEKVEGNVEIVLSEKLEARKVNVGEHVNEDTESVDSVIVHQDRGTEYEYDNDYRDIDGEYDNNKKDEEEQEEEVEA